VKLYDNAMLDKEFCAFLESKLNEAFTNSPINEIKHFWCDGILLPPLEKYYSKKFVNDNRKIVMMKVFTGLTGQDKYELTLNFGSKALSRYARDLDISESWLAMGSN
jgi:hypothetical protein